MQYDVTPRVYHIRSVTWCNVTTYQTIPQVVIELQQKALEEYRRKIFGKKKDQNPTEKEGTEKDATEPAGSGEADVAQSSSEQDLLAKRRSERDAARRESDAEVGIGAGAGAGADSGDSPRDETDSDEQISGSSGAMLEGTSDESGSGKGMESSRKRRGVGFKGSLDPIGKTLV